MVRKKSEDIFKQLKKQKPLVKRKDLQPLSSQDFAPERNSFDTMIEKRANKKHVGHVHKSASEVNIIPETKKKTVYKKPQQKQGATLANRYNHTKKQVVSKNQELDIFAEKTKSDTNAKFSDKLDIFSKKTTSVEAKHSPINREVMLPKKKIKVETKKENKLSFRHELKYYINYTDYVLLSNALKSLMSLDENAGDDLMYHIRSLYFDDIYETALEQKIAGSDDRSKYRIRIYNYSDEVIKFEKKIKKGQYIAKKSIRLSRNECDKILAGDYDFLKDRNERLASEIYIEMKNNLLRPRVLVDYEREAYVYPIENVRITFDKNLKGGLLLTDIFNSNAPVMPMFDRGIMVLEVKFNRYLPEFIKGVLNNVNAASRSAISKYVICRKFD